MKIDENFFKEKDKEKLAKKFLGLKLVYKKNKNEILSGIINEVELYTEEDEASHSYKGKLTKRNKIMFKNYGHLYVYFTYGMYHCINIVIGDEGKGEAILIRSIIPEKNSINNFIKNRYNNKYDINNIPKEKMKNLTNGPSKLSIAYGFDLSYNGLNLLDKDSKIYLEKTNLKPKKIKELERIGISKAKEKKWRFYTKEFEEIR
jgi:DNA-3-methyladenine glycosylase